MGTRWVLYTGAFVAMLAVAWRPLTPKPAPEANTNAVFDCLVQPVERIPPGTRIADGPPDGWTHLISKSLPKLASGDAEKLHARAAELASFLFTTIVAHVGRQETPQGPVYRLERLATGLGTRIGEDQVIISSATQRELGADLGFLERLVLAGAEKQMDQLVEIARSETSRIVDMPTIMLLDGEHRPVVLRYVYLVHPEDGRLEAVVWRIDLDSDGNYSLAEGPAVRRYLGRVESCPLHVDARETIAGVPKPRAFATTGMPSGDPLPLPDALREIAGSRELTSSMAEQIDTEIRRALGFLPKP